MIALLISAMQVSSFPEKQSASSLEETVVVGNPTVPSYHARVNGKKYKAMKAVLLKIFPKEEPGMTQSEMMKTVAKYASKKLFPGTTYMWWAKCVQLDLELKKVLLRDKKAKPLRWRLTK